MRPIRIREKVAVPLVRQYHQLRVRNPLRQNIRRHPVIDLAGHVSIIRAHQDQRRLADVFQAAAGIVTLTGQKMAQVELHRAEILHSHFQVVLDTFGILLRKLVGKADQD